jgi:N-acetylmuramoyl-L-alanine amidase
MLPGAADAILARAVLLALLAFAPPALWAVELASARIWPAQEYTRLTLEAPAAIRHRFFILPNPQRLVLDLEDVALSDVVLALPSKVRADDPYIKLLRMGLYRPGLLRLVLDMKTEVKANVFPVPPVGQYLYRLVLDIYPAVPIDPLAALLDQIETRPASPGGPAEHPDHPQPAETKRAIAPQAAPVHESETASAGALQAPSGGGISRSRRSRSKSKPEPEPLRLIAIDAGHGGEDPGARGSRGTLEKNVTLAIARRLQQRVNSAGLRAVLVRDGDYFIPLQGRIAKARKLRAELFVSIHADAYITREARGSSVFALSENGATSAAAQWLAKRENEADLIGGINLNLKDPYLARTLLDLSQTATINDSLKLGKAVLTELGDMNALHKGWVEQAGFAVLKSPDIPSILVEAAFITNKNEERRLSDPGFQDKVARAVLAGIRRYFAYNPHRSPRIAKQG